MIDRESLLAQAYLWRRQTEFPMCAKHAFDAARQDIAAGTRRFAHGVGWKLGGNWQPFANMPRHASLSDRPYFCDEWPSGWRVSGRADEVGRACGSRAVDHSGWYTDDDGDTGTLAGYVLQIPARDGVPQYIPGTRYSEYDGVTLYPLDRYSDAMDCARAADRYAEIAAEHERDYQRADQAGIRAAELRDEAIAARREILSLCADLRVGKASLNSIDTISDQNAIGRLCAIVRDKVSDLLSTMAESRTKRDKLVDDYGRETAFRENY